MESYTWDPNRKSLLPKEFPEAEKLIDVQEHPISRQIGNLSLHRSDMHLAHYLLKQINKISDVEVKLCLFNYSIIVFFKCFSENKSRSNLDYKKVYKEPRAHEAFLFFKSLRDKHIAHDENPLYEVAVGAVLNKKSADHKIAKIISANKLVPMLNQDNYSNLDLLISKCVEWIEVEYESICNLLTAALEKTTYDDLFSYKELFFKHSTIAPEDVHKSRKNK